MLTLLAKHETEQKSSTATQPFLLTKQRRRFFGRHQHPRDQQDESWRPTADSSLSSDNVVLATGRRGRLLSLSLVHGQTGSRGIALKAGAKATSPNCNTDSTIPLEPREPPAGLPDYFSANQDKPTSLLPAATETMNNWRQHLPRRIQWPFHEHKTSARLC